MQTRFLPLLALSALAGFAQAQCTTLSATSAGGNGQKGAMFDLVNVSANPVTVQAFRQAFFAAGTDTVEIYTKAGTFNGFQTNAAAWGTPLGTASVTHGVSPTRDLLPIPVNVTIAPGATQGFWISVTSATAGNVSYTTGAAQFLTSIGTDGTLDIIGGNGVTYPLGTVFGGTTAGSAGRLWNGDVIYGNACTLVPATAQNFGSGCQRAAASFYENFATAAAFDLGNNNLSLIGSPFTVVPNISTLNPVGATSTTLALTDDSEATYNFVNGFTAPGWGTSVTVCSNGFVSKASGNGTGFTPTVATFLAGTQDWFSVGWHDFNPAIAGSGQVKVEETASLLTITWDGVWDFGGTSAANASTMQMRVDSAGTVVYAYGTMSTLGNGFLTGFSPAGANLDLGGTDLSALSALTLSTVDVAEMRLTANNRPIQGAAPTAVTLTSSNLPATTVIHIGWIGLTQLPGVPLAVLGGPADCNAYVSLDLIQDVTILPAGPVTWTGLTVPAAPPSFIGLQFFAQSASLDLGSILNSNTRSSNGVAFSVGTF